MLNLIVTVVLLACAAAVVDLDGVEVSLLRRYGVSGTNGTVFLNTTTTGSGLVCAAGVEDKTAELLCNRAGYKYLLGFNSTLDYYDTTWNYNDELDCDTMIERDISVLAANLTCPGNATDMGNCTALPASCDVDTALWLDCTNDDGLFWKLTNVTLAHNKVGTHNVTDLEVGGVFGTVLITMNNTRTGEEKTGFVQYTYNSDTLAALCYFAGHGVVKYPSGEKTGRIRARESSKISCGYILENKTRFALKYLRCDNPKYSYNQHLSRCRFNEVEPEDTISVGDALWLKCK
eukprot:sb/3467664/